MITFSIQGKEIPVLLSKKSIKKIYMRFDDTGTLVVNAPRYISEKEIQKALSSSKSSLEKMYVIYEKKQEKKKYFYYLGKPYIPVFLEQQTHVEFKDNQVYAQNETMLNQFYKKECLRLFSLEVHRISPYFPDIPDFSLRIRSMKTRWGVCNRKNNIVTLNSELLKKELHLLDYVIIHELCHFYEANHSSKFWKHVEEFYPDYKLARKELNYD